MSIQRGQPMVEPLTADDDDAVVLHEEASAPMHALLSLANTESHNFTAEVLMRQASGLWDVNAASRATERWMFEQAEAATLRGEYVPGIIGQQVRRDININRTLRRLQVHPAVVAKQEARVEMIEKAGPQVVKAEDFPRSPVPRQATPKGLRARCRVAPKGNSRQ